jgi:hypothetical protein
MSDDEYVAIQKLTHPLTGATVYMPEGQELPDTKAMLERDGLISCKYNEHGKFVSALVHDPQNIRVICWQLTVNAEHNTSAVSPSLRTRWAICAKIFERARPDIARPQLPQQPLRQRAASSTADGLIRSFMKRSEVAFPIHPTTFSIVAITPEMDRSPTKPRTTTIINRFNIFSVL